MHKHWINRYQRQASIEIRLPRVGTMGANAPANFDEGQCREKTNRIKTHWFHIKVLSQVWKTLLK